MKSSSSSEIRFSWLTAALLLLGGAAAVAQTPQQHVHAMSHQVMPFDMAKTVHVFRMTETGGVQRVVAKNENDAGQIALIRQHLRHEAVQFSQGNYSDPATLHGASMPGLADVQTGAAQIAVRYADVPGGAALTFEATDIHLITALHRWFGAQLSEHGADARAE